MDDSRKFFNALYGELGEGEYIEIRFTGNKTKQMFFETAEAASKAADGLKKDGNIYFGVATRDGKGGRKANIVRIPSLWADLDYKEELPSLAERLGRVEILLPSAVVSSGSGLHVYWFLSEAVGKERIPEIEALNKRIAAWLDGDTVHDASRVLRVPDTLNFKHPEPKDVKLYELQPERRYNIEHVCDTLGVRGNLTPRNSSSDSLPDTPLSAGVEGRQLDFSPDHFPSLPAERGAGGEVLSAHSSSLIPQDSEDDFGLISVEELLEMEVTEPEFVIEGLVPKQGITLLTGEGGLGKSYITVDIACCVATGSDFLGKFAVQQGAVLMVDLENNNSAKHHRITKLLSGRSEYGSKMPVFFMQARERHGSRLAVDEKRGSDHLERMIREVNPKLVVIDPLVAAHSRDENDNVAMRQVFTNLQDLAMEYDLAIIVVHHTRKRGINNDAGQMIRGASDLRNAVDSHIFIRKLPERRLLVEHDKSRHAPEIEKFVIERSEDPSTGGLSFVFAGSSNEGHEKSAEARECILDVLREVGECRRKELLGRLLAQKLSKTTIERCLNRLVDEGVVFRPDRGAYALSPEQQELAV